MPTPSHPPPNSVTARPSHNPAFSEISLDVSLAKIRSARSQFPYFKVEETEYCLKILLEQEMRGSMVEVPQEPDF